MRYGFVIDLKRCYGCYSCQVACKAANNTPRGVDFARCLQGETGTYPNALRQMLPTLCMQCAEPECLKVCPTGATKQDEAGIVTVDKKLCMGCKYCMMACPYGQRHSVPGWSTYFPDAEGELDFYQTYAKGRWEERNGYGIATKCDFCKDRVKEGKKPACAEACPAKARYFGDLDDPESEVSILIKRERGFQLNPEFGTEPSVYYLPAR
ncbi:MAG: 4Fe-4S dicluster domain-containing protein [Candidatus Eiseniibacteriota bacterium]|nr:MAG: 4Fe-4S dicluster domain-containing protein [Candidatus Eisenbacteria bacterium]